MAKRLPLHRQPTKTVVITLFILGVFVVALVLGALADQSKQWQSASWYKADAVVTKSETSVRGLWSKRLTFSYEYAVDGSKYASSYYRPSLSAAWFFRSKSAFAAEHPVGSTLVVFYDPTSPSRVVLEPGGSWTDVGAFALLLILVAWQVGRCLAELYARLTSARLQRV